MEFKSPQNSLAHLALIQAVEGSGLDTFSLRRLLWLINANPLLVGHAQVFEHVLAHFDSPIFLPRNLIWASAWKDDIPKWLKICDWIVKNRRKLIGKPGLEEFDQYRDQRHPHLYTGVGRHGVVAALWNQHYACKHYPPVIETDPNAALRYFQLQGHLLASYAESRFKLSSLEFFEKYDGELERPIAPIRTQPIGLVVRDLSLKKYSDFVGLLPSCESTLEFAVNVAYFRITNKQRMDLKIDESTDQYLAVIKLYFDRFSEVLLGWIPKQSSKTGGGGGGGGGSRAHRHGFINVPGPVGVYLEEDPAPHNDPDLVEPPGQPVLINMGWAKAQKDSTQITARVSSFELEESGLSPTETLEEALRLYSPEEFKGRIRDLYYQRLAAESAAQGLAFDYCQLTPTEINDVFKRALDWADCKTIGPPSGIAIDSEAVGLIVCIMLFLGQPMQHAWSVRCIWRDPSTPIEQIHPVNGKLTLIICAPKIDDWEDAVIDGFCLPGITPTYKTDLADGLEAIDADSVDSFVLPDVFGIGQKVLGYVRKHHLTDVQGFGMSAESASKSVTAFCKSFSNPRITSEKIARVLASLVTSKTGDQSLAWVLTANQSKANQTRMFYTRHSVNRLLKAYLLVAKHLSKAAKASLLVIPKKLDTTAFSPGVGARFVTSITEVRKLVASLREDLCDELPNDPEEEFFRWYHNTFVFYTHLYQSLDTSLRAISAPNDLYRIATKSVLDFGAAHAALSDKDTAYSSRARLVAIRKPLQKQFENYARHLDCLGTHVKSAQVDIELASNRSPFFIFDADRRLRDLTPTAFEKAMKDHRAVDIPANFHRAFLRSQLLDRGCPAEVVDAHLGHANFGESPFSRLSTFDYRLHLDQISKTLQEIHDDIGLLPIKSRIAFKRTPVKRP